MVGRARQTVFVALVTILIAISLFGIASTATVTADFYTSQNSDTDRIQQDIDPDDIDPDDVYMCGCPDDLPNPDDPDVLEMYVRHDVANSYYIDYQAWNPERVDDRVAEVVVTEDEGDEEVVYENMYKLSSRDVNDRRTGGFSVEDGVDYEVEITIHDADVTMEDGQQEIELNDELDSATGTFTPDTDANNNYHIYGDAYDWSDYATYHTYNTDRDHFTWNLLYFSDEPNYYEGVDQEDLPVDIFEVMDLPLVEATRGDLVWLHPQEDIADWNNENHQYMPGTGEETMRFYFQEDWFTEDEGGEGYPLYVEEDLGDYYQDGYVQTHSLTPSTRLHLGTEFGGFPGGNLYEDTTPRIVAEDSTANQRVDYWIDEPEDEQEGDLTIDDAPSEDELGEEYSEIFAEEYGVTEFRWYLQTQTSPDAIHEFQVDEDAFPRHPEDVGENQLPTANAFAQTPMFYSTGEEFFSDERFQDFITEVDLYVFIQQNSWEVMCADDCFTIEDAEIPGEPEEGDTYDVVVDLENREPLLIEENVETTRQPRVFGDDLSLIDPEEEWVNADSENGDFESDTRVIEEGGSKTIVFEDIGEVPECPRDGTPVDDTTEVTTAGETATVSAHDDCPAPDADIDGPSESEPGDQVTFDASGSDHNSEEIVSYDWFRDASGTGETTTETFEEEGTYTISVEVENDKGVVDTTSTTVTISDPDDGDNGDDDNGDGDNGDDDNGDDDNGDDPPPPGGPGPSPVSLDGAGVLNLNENTVDVTDELIQSNGLEETKSEKQSIQTDISPSSPNTPGGIEPIGDTEFDAVYLQGEPVDAAEASHHGSGRGEGGPEIRWALVDYEEEDDEMVTVEETNYDDVGQGSGEVDIQYAHMPNGSTQIHVDYDTDTGPASTPVWDGFTTPDGQEISVDYRYVSVREFQWDYVMADGEDGREDIRVDEGVIRPIGPEDEVIEEGKVNEYGWWTKARERPAVFSAYPSEKGTFGGFDVDEETIVYSNSAGSAENPPPIGKDGNENLSIDMKDGEYEVTDEIVVEARGQHSSGDILSEEYRAMVVGEELDVDEIDYVNVHEPQFEAITLEHDRESEEMIVDIRVTDEHGVPIDTENREAEHIIITSPHGTVWMVETDSDGHITWAEEVISGSNIDRTTFYGDGYGVALNIDVSGEENNSPNLNLNYNANNWWEEQDLDDAHNDRNLVDTNEDILLTGSPDGIVGVILIFVYYVVVPFAFIFMCTWIIDEAFDIGIHPPWKNFF